MINCCVLSVISVMWNCIDHACDMFMLFLLSFLCSDAVSGTAVSNAVSCVEWNAHISVIRACFVCVFSVKCKLRTLEVRVQGSRSARVSVRERVSSRRARDPACGARDHAPSGAFLYIKRRSLLSAVHILPSSEHFDAHSSDFCSFLLLFLCFFIVSFCFSLFSSIFLLSWIFLLFPRIWGMIWVPVLVPFRLMISILMMCRFDRL